MSPRYARQQLLDGWEQARLQAAVLAIVGQGPLAFLCSVMAAALGFGRILLLDGAGRRPDQRRLPASLAAGAQTRGDWLMRLNPGIKAYGYPLGLRRDLPERLPRLDAVIIASNDPADWLAGWRLASQTCRAQPPRESDPGLEPSAVPILAGATAGGLGLWGPIAPDPLLARICRLPESPLLSQIVAALLVEEARRRVLPLPGEDGPADRLNRLAIPLPMSATGTGRCRRRPLPSLALVGAGALGNWFGLALGLAGVPAVLSIYDHDEIEETNLNRQVLFHDAVGEPKAITLADRLHEWFPQLSLSGYAVRVEPATQRLLLESGALVACPDSFAVRALLNRLGRGYRRPLLSGGTSASSGSALVYAPGATACLSCRLRIDQLAEVEQAPARCGQVRQASVVTSNAIVGALLVVLLLGLAANSPEPGTWEYDSHPRNDRLGRHSPWPACTCRTGSGG